MSALLFIAIIILVACTVSIKAAITVCFLLTCTIICIWVKRNIKVSGASTSKSALCSGMVTGDFVGGSEDAVLSFDEATKGKRVY